MKKIFFLIVLLSSFAIAQTVTIRGMDDDSTRHIVKTDELGRLIAMPNGAISTGGMTSTITTEIDSLLAPSGTVWCAVIYSQNGILEWDTNRTFTSSKIIYNGMTTSTGLLNKNALPKIFFRRLSGQNSTLNYSIDTYGY